MLNQKPILIRLIQLRLRFIDLRLQWITVREDHAVLAGGYGAKGELDPERERLIDESNRLLDRLEALGGTLPFQFV